MQARYIGDTVDDAIGRVAFIGIAAQNPREICAVSTGASRRLSKT
jgi:hypothetical protein